MNDFEELFASLTRHGAKAVVVGAYAMAFHGRPRYTKDFDVLIEPTPENAAKVLAALHDFGFGGLGLNVSDFEPGRIVQLGMPPNRIDLLTRIDGVSFEDVWNSRVSGSSGGVTMHFIDRETLIRNKKASARPQDLVDVEVLERMRDSI